MLLIGICYLIPMVNAIVASFYHCCRMVSQANPGTAAILPSVSCPEPAGALSSKVEC